MPIRFSNPAGIRRIFSNWFATLHRLTKATAGEDGTRLQEESAKWAESIPNQRHLFADPVNEPDLVDDHDS